jgi:hypothetical protein
MAKVSDYAEYPKSLIGYTDGLLQALPPLNADGTPNQEAQDKAVQGLVDAMASAGIFRIPDVTPEKVAGLAKTLVATVQAYKTATGRTVL